jgi:ketosteroid isomerase-like protein
MEDTGKYLTLWEKQADGSLKIKVETWNTDKNPMMPKQ